MTTVIDRWASRPAARPVESALADDALRGLLGRPKTLPPKLFYDATGALLFEQICELPEYYLTRAESAILRERAQELASLAGPKCALIEYGSGAGVKTRLLLDALVEPTAYVPIDVSREQLRRVASSMARAYPALSVRPAWADYMMRFELPSLPAGARPLAFFPGSTIGNLHPTEAAAFLRRVRRTVGSGGAMVLGLDRRKDARVLTAAYNDAAGVTARFNLNVLARFNRELDAGWDLSRFRHRAIFDDATSRIEMHLVSQGRQHLRLQGLPIDFADGETIWTESSYKYDRRRLDDLLRGAGFDLTRLWTDPERLFWVAFLTAS